MSLPYDPAVPRLRSREAAALPPTPLAADGPIAAAPLTNAPLPKADGSMADNPADHSAMAHGSVADGPEALSKGPVADGPGPARSNGRTPSDGPSSDGNAIPPSNDVASAPSDRPTPLFLSRQATDRPSQGGVVSHSPISYPLQFGIYRDGDNNLDEAQAPVIDQAKQVSEDDCGVAVNVEDTTERDDDLCSDAPLHTEEYDFINGREMHATVTDPQDMAKRSTLAGFVEHTLDAAERNGAKVTWLDLVDHGGGDGGAFQTDMSGGNVMREDDIAGAIADGVRAHAEAHPEDAKRGIDGVLLNACLMASCGMESALSHAGVRYLAASPETMIAPGAPSTIAEDIAAHSNDPAAMARAIVHRAMSTRYAIGDLCYGPAAAFDVLDLDPQKIVVMEHSVKQLNAAIVTAAKDPHAKAEIKADSRDIEGMTRSQDPRLPWHIDKPAEELYGVLAQDRMLSAELRAAARNAESAIAATVMAHGESRGFAPFGDASYRDAVGPTVHFPLSKKQIDPWAPIMSETKNAFAKQVDEASVARALA
jgi:hypothetical protein